MKQTQIYKKTKELDVTTEVLDDRPDYYSNMVGNPYVGRLNSGVSIDTSLLKIWKTDEFILTNSQLTEYIYHGLGFTPTIMGTYIILDDYNTDIIGKRGRIPEYKKEASSTTPTYYLATDYQADSEKYRLSFSVNSSQDFPEIFKVRVKIHLLRDNYEQQRH